VSEFEGIDPRDIEDLQARAEKIVSDAETYYEISLLVSHQGAEEFMELYAQAVDGQMAPLLELMGIIHILARSLDIAMAED
jgi:hypothetical protein